MPVEIPEIAVNAEISQDTRLGSLQTDLGKDKLALVRFAGTEAMSELFEFHVEAISNEHNIDFDKLLGTNCVVSIGSGYQGVKRHFHGALVEARWNGKTAELSSYQLVMRPWFWLLTRTLNCRIFSDKSAPKIINEVLGHYGFAKFKVKTTHDYPTMEYCVQYRESDFAFVSRLMEEFGIYYFFDHSEGEHTMILADTISLHEPKVGGADLSYYSSDLRGTREEDSLHEWVPGRSLRTGKVALNDYNYGKPKDDLLAEKEAASKYANGQLEHYDYPGRYIEKSDGRNLANVLLEGEQAKDKVHSAAGNAVSCSAGRLINLAKHDEATLNKEYLTLRASHSYRHEGYRSGGGNGADYSGAYEFQPSDVPFRAPRVTPKPLIYGPQTAFVVSEVDDKCRIKVQFHWERDKKASRYVRIGHGWAGKRWGDLKIPRVGMEVIVEFLEGDPDQPLVTGTVYNAENEPPYDLPSNKWVSGTKSRSYDQSSGYNEFIFKDQPGHEVVQLHAEKDMDGTIKHNETRSVGNNSSLTIGNNSSIKVGNSSDVMIGSNRNETIGASWLVTAGTNITFTCGASSMVMTPASIIITSPMIAVTSQANTVVTAGAAFAVTAGGAVAITAGAACTITAGGPAVFHGLPPIVG